MLSTEIKAIKYEFKTAEIQNGNPLEALEAERDEIIKRLPKEVCFVLTPSSFKM
jgi:hypothetical protein